MKTVLVTGGTDGIGKGMVLHYLNEGYRVFAIGSNLEKGNNMVAEVKNPNFTFIQANLSLVAENKRVVEIISKEIEALDTLVLCAASLKPQESFVKTQEGTEFTFSLYYLSRYILCYQLKELLEKSQEPVIVNVAAPGMKGPLYLEDLQMEKNYNGQQAQFHGSRLNDLLGVHFTETDPIGKIRYILFNPMAARTSGAAKMAGDKGAMKVMMNLYYKFCGKDVGELVSIICDIIAKTKTSGLSAYKLDKVVDLNMETFDKSNALKLHEYTESLM